MEFLIFGRTRLRGDDGQFVQLGARQQRGLLALLLYCVGEPVQTDLIVERLWNARDLGGAEYRERLYPLVSRVRAVLRGAGVNATLEIPDGFDGYRLRMDRGLVDYHQFRRLVDQADQAARTGRHDLAVAILSRAFALWDGIPLADLRSDGAEAERRRLTHHVLIDAYKRLFDSLLAIHDHRRLLTTLGRLREAQQVDDLDETLALQWMLALEGAGQRAEALRYYQDFRQRSLREIGAEPSRELHDTYRRMLDDRSRERRPAAGRALFLAPHQLPRDVPDFTGRADLVARLDELMAPPGSAATAVAIIGMPGVGKSALAAHWAHSRLDRFPDGQLYLDAGGYGPAPPVTPDDALSRLLHGLGVSAAEVPASREHRQAVLARLLTGRRVVIVIDNVSHPAQVRPLLSAAASCPVLLTSRSTLDGLAIKDGVRVVPVPLLSPPESAELLRAMIGVGRADGDRKAVAVIADACGGLPLALRIAGQHLSLRPQTPLADLVDQLGDRFTERADTSDPDGASLDAVFAWSYDGLAPDVAAMFRLLGLYPGDTLSIEAAAAMLARDVRTAGRLLEVLVRESLLEDKGARRYQVHDLLRRFAAERLHDEDEAGNQRSALRRLLRWFLLSANAAATRLAPSRSPVPDLPVSELVEPLTFDTDDSALRWCEAERDNVLSLTRCAAENNFHQLAWQIPGTLHEVAERFGVRDDLVQCQLIAVSSANLSGHVEGQLGTVANTGGTFFRLGDFERAARYFTDGLRLARKAGHREGEATCLHGLGAVRLEQGDAEGAIAYLEQAVAIHRAMGNLANEGYSLHRLSAAHRRLCRYDRALDYSRRALAVRERIGSLRGQGATHAELATIHLDAGRYQVALEHCQRALALHARTGDRAMTCEVLFTLAAVHRGLDNAAEATAAVRRATLLAEELNNPRLREQAMHLLEAVPKLQ